MTEEEFIDRGMERYVTAEKAEDIRQAREQSKEVKRKYGGAVPQSIIKADFKKRQKDIHVEARSRGKELASCPELGPTNRSSKIKALSRFPWNVGEIVIRLFTEEGDWVFDPFAGHNSRMEIVFVNGRHYRGHDLSAEFMDYNRQIKDDLLSQALLTGEHPKIELYEGDSTQIELYDEEKGFYDFSLTSPPYYDLEDYGPEKAQLGFKKSYWEFLEGLRKVMEITLGAIKPGGYVAWFVNDFRRNREYHIFHADVARLFEEVGFQLWDIIIIDLGHSVRAAFANQFESYKIFPKKHEYGVIVRKPMEVTK